MEQPKKTPTTPETEEKHAQNTSNPNTSNRPDGLKFTDAFVINLDRRDDRMQNFTQNCPKNLFREVIRLSAVDGTLFSKSESPNDADLMAELQRKHPNIEQEMQDLFCSTLKFVPFKVLNNGEKGCFLSHVSIWKKIVDGTVASPCLILEDDTQFEPWFADSVTALHRSGTWQAVEDRGAILYLGGRSIRNFRTSVVLGKPFDTSLSYQTEMDGVDDLQCLQDYFHCVFQFLDNEELKKDPTLNQYHPRNYHRDRTTHSYVISRNAAEILLKKFHVSLSESGIPGVYSMPVDHFITWCGRTCKFPLLTLSPLPSFSTFGDSDIR